MIFTCLTRWEPDTPLWPGLRVGRIEPGKGWGLTWYQFNGWADPKPIRQHTALIRVGDFIGLTQWNTVVVLDPFTAVNIFLKDR